MKRARAWAGVLMGAWIAWTATASAQPPPGQPAPPNVPATREQADRLIAEAMVAAQDAASDEVHRLLRTVRDKDNFTNQTTGGVARLQHKASGAVCQFGRNTAVNRLLQLANGFTCISGRAFGAENLEISYQPTAASADAEAMIGKFLADQFPDAQPADGYGDIKARDAAGRPLPDHVTRRFAATAKNGARLFIRISYATVGDWLLLQRAVGAVGAARLVDGQAEQEMVGEIRQMARRQDQALQLGPALTRR